MHLGLLKGYLRSLAEDLSHSRSVSRSVRPLYILTTLTPDIQCEKFIEDESVSHEPYDSMYPNIC